MKVLSIVRGKVFSRRFISLLSGFQARKVKPDGWPPQHLNTLEADSDQVVSVPAGTQRDSAPAVKHNQKEPSDTDAARQLP